MKHLDQSTMEVEHRDRLLTIAEVAQMTGLSIGGLYHLVSQQRIPVVRISRRCIRFRLASLDRWIEELTDYPNRKTKGGA